LYIDYIFSSDIYISILNLIEEKFLFCKLSSNDFNLNYTRSLLPGHKEGVSGTSVGGYNIGINKYSAPEKRDSVIETYKFLTSKKIQKELLIKYRIGSGIMSLYEDEEVCKNVDCEIFKKIQPIGRPNLISYDYDSYSELLRKYVYEFLYGNSSSYDVLKKIDDILKIYNISIYGDNTTLAYIFYFIFSFFIVLMLSSLIMLYFMKFESYFSFLSTDFWFLVIIGIICILCQGILENGPRTILKCELSISFLMIGSTLILIPILHKLIVNFPEENKFSIWIANHKFIFIIFFIGIDIIHLIILSSLYTIKQITPTEMKNFEICALESKTLSYLDIISITVIKSIVLIIILVLIYSEWNLKRTLYDLRFVVLAIYTDILFLIMLFFMKTINNTNYISHYIKNSIFYLLFSLLNYSILYFSRIVMILLKKDNDESLFIKNINKQFINNESSIMKTMEISITQNQSTTTKNIINNSNFNIDDNSNNELNSHNNDTKGYIIKKIYEYHKKSYSSKSFIEDNSNY